MWEKKKKKVVLQQMQRHAFSQAVMNKLVKHDLLNLQYTVLI